MRIPPLYKRTTFQRFLAGLFIGVLCGWFFFLFQYGQLYNQLMIQLSEQRSTITSLEARIAELNSEQTKLNEENKRKLTIQTIEIELNNARRLRLNQLTQLELRTQIMEELQHLEREDIESVANMKDLLIQALENKVFKVDDNEFQVDVQGLYLFTTLRIEVAIKPASN
ncbi:sporulation membrane protein YtrI [Bacillus sp. JCM 19034]|uniref:sporulation membrane protein YtrI n=1 Tax=Bacillus sp. JCM 19034 TaxID=1481928 RepID=UPI00078466E5|nr:sporulation membrane protein YtrI [Bacillus sp. JCM 19034]